MTINIYIMFTTTMNILDMMMIKPVTSRDQVIDNIERYNAELEKFADLMPYARAWYALPTENGWLLGPSKFIGYQELSADTYLNKGREPLDGRMTESILQRWADLIEEGNPRYDELHTVLNELCARFGKKPNSLARISIIYYDEPSAEAASGNELVELLAAVYRRLTPADKTAFRKRIA
jgi:hypothetical protein